MNFQPCLDPPSVPQLLGDLSPYRRKGDIVSLTCLASGGNPLPELTWMRNGLPLRDSGKPMLLVINNCNFSKILKDEFKTFFNS